MDLDGDGDLDIVSSQGLPTNENHVESTSFANLRVRVVPPGRSRFVCPI